MLTNENWNLAIDSIQRPVHYDPLGQWISDRTGQKVCEIRGWGRLQSLSTPENRQDSIGEFICELINSAEKR